MRTIFIDSNSNYEKLLNESVLLQGENLATEVLFEIPSDMVGYNYAMLFQLEDETPVITESLPVNEYNQVSYIINNSLTSSTGKLKLELQASDVTGVLIKSTKITFNIRDSINGNNIEVMPESYVPWYTQVMQGVNTVNAGVNSINNALAIADLTKYASKVTVDAQIASVVSGSPKAVSLLSQMVDTTKNYVYTGVEVGYTTGNWYYYNGSAWVSGGTYQSTGVADNSITGEKLGKTYSLLDKAVLNAEKRINGYDSIGIVLTASTSYNTYQLTLPMKGKLKIFKSTMPSGQLFTIHDSTGKGTAVMSYSVDNGVHATYRWLEVFATYYTIDINLLKSQFSDTSSMYIQTYVADNSLFFIEAQNIIPIDDYKWIDMTNSIDTRALKDKCVIPTKLADNYNLISTGTILLNTYSNGFTSDKVLVNYPDSNYFLATIPLPSIGTLKVKKSTISKGQGMILISGGLGLTNIAPSFITTNTFISLYSDYFIIDILGLKSKYPTCDSLQITFATVDLETAYAYGLGTQNIEWLNTKPTINPILQDKVFILPTNIPCVVNREIHVYLDNILQYGNAYKAERIEVRGEGDIFEYGYEYKPSVGSVQETINIDYYTGKSIGLTGKTILKPIPENAGSGLTKKIIIIGESTSDNNSFMGELGNLFADDVMNVNLMGTRGTAPNMNEARSGWTSTLFTTVQQYGSQSVVNAFYNPSTLAFDFPYYMAQQSFESVDYVCINLGINDAYEKLTTVKVIENYTVMINSIHAFDPNIKIFIGLSNLPERFSNIGLKYLKDSILEIIKALISQYGNREEEGYFLIPIYTNIDPLWDMQYTDRAISARNTKTTPIGTNGVHPSSIGYYKMADTHYNVFKYATSLG